MLWITEGLQPLFNLLFEHETTQGSSLPVQLAVYVSIISQRMTAIVDGKEVAPWDIPFVP